MLSQHIIEDQRQAENEQEKGIIVPLDLPDLEMVRQEWQTDGIIEVQVKAKTDREICPHCGTVCVKIHDTRKRVKRDRNLGT